MKEVKIINLTKAYGTLLVLNQINMQIPTHRIIGLHGPSGTGKTTFLRILAGLEGYEGEIVGLTHEVAFLFQEDRLLPWLTIYENLDLVLEGKESERIRQEKIKNVLELVELEGLEEKKPAELSGGMQRRVAIARALILEHELLLLDEPFKGLDQELKERIMKRIAVMELDKTIIFVSHDRNELEHWANTIITLEHK